jgi:hypothetical protein
MLDNNKYKTRSISESFLKVKGHLKEGLRNMFDLKPYNSFFAVNIIFYVINRHFSRNNTHH